MEQSRAEQSVCGSPSPIPAGQHLLHKLPAFLWKKKRVYLCIVFSFIALKTKDFISEKSCC